MYSGEQGRPAAKRTCMFALQENNTSIQSGADNRLVGVKTPLATLHPRSSTIIYDPYASGFADAPLVFSKLKQENMGAPSAGGIAH